MRPDPIAGKVDVVDHPFIRRLVEFCQALNVLVMIQGHEVLDGEADELDLLPQIPDGLQHVLSLHLELPLQVQGLLLRLLVPVPELLQLRRHLHHLLLCGGVLLLEVQLLLLLLLELLLSALLLAALVLHVGLSFPELILLLHGLFHDLRAHKHLVLHGLQLLHHLRVRLLLLVLDPAPLLQLRQEPVLLLLREVLLLLDEALLFQDLPLHLLPLLLEARLDGIHVFLRDARAHDLLHRLLYLHDLLHLDDLLLHDDLLLLRLLGRRRILLLRLLDLGRLLGGHGPRRLGRALRQLHAEAGDLVLELADHRVLGVLVDLGLVLDALGAVGVAQRRERLVVVVVRGAEVCHHDRLRVAAQGVLEQARELRVPVGDVRGLAVHERGDHVAERRQGEVDLGGLLQPVAGGAGLALPLGARQVDHVQLADADVALAVGSQRALLHRDHEDRVRPRRTLVHVGRRNAPVREPLLQDLVHVLDALHHEGLKILHIDAVLSVLELAALLWILRQEVADLLVVDL
mmetsp:Transcript_27415/g.78766  ORF Transcript_27415/g.78766 Transcript_27415/m.78766 type:complete len:517 (-) Transcript_27415:561-2111(-)